MDSTSYLHMESDTDFPFTENQARAMINFLVSSLPQGFITNEIIDNSIILNTTGHLTDDQASFMQRLTRENFTQEVESLVNLFGENTIRLSSLWSCLYFVCLPNGANIRGNSELNFDNFISFTNSIANRHAPFIESDLDRLEELGINLRQLVTVDMNIRQPSGNTNPSSGVRASGASSDEVMQA